MISNFYSLFDYTGGPVVVEETNAFGEFPRFLLLGVIHGSFLKCSNNFPGMFVETDHLTVLEFLHREVYGSGLKYLNIKFFSVKYANCLTESDIKEKIQNDHN